MLVIIHEHKAAKPKMWIPLPLWITVQVLGFALTFFVNPWFLIINIYIAPVLRFSYWASFSILIADCTFGTEDGGLHMAAGPILYLLFSPMFLAEFAGQFIKKLTSFDEER